MSSSRPSDSDMSNYDDEIKNVFHVVGPSQRKEVKRVLQNKAILSSTTLQMFLYYNFFFSLAYAWFFVLIFRWKYLNHSGLRVNYFSPIFFSIWSISEVIRIYVGYQGNLKEDTPNMAAFLFLTIFPQMLITIYMLSMQVPLYGFDRIFSGIMLALLCVEFLIGWRCLGMFISDKTARFSVEYGGVDGGDNQPDTTDVVALNRFIDEGDEQAGDEFAGIDELSSTHAALIRSRQHPRLNTSTRGGLSSSRAGATGMYESPIMQDDVIQAPARDLTELRASFGGTGVQPMARSYGRSSARGSALPPLLNAPLPPAELAASTASMRLGTSALAASQRLNETPEERAFRRARDRAIISGDLVPERRRDESAFGDAEAIARETELREQQARMDRENALSTSRPAMATLASSPQAAVRIPLRPDLLSPSSTANLKTD